MKIVITKIGILTLCAFLTFLAIRGTLTPVTHRLGPGALQKHNSEYLDTTLKKALGGFGVMTGIKTGLAIIEGSTVGASFVGTAEVQAGDIVQSVYDYVDIAWRTLFIGSVTILAIKHLLAAVGLLKGYILGFTLLMLGVSLALRWWGNNWYRARDIVRDILSIAIVTLLATYYILPVSVWGAAQLSETITQPSVEKAQKGFAETETKLFPETDTEPPEGFIAKAKKLPDRISEVTIYLKEKSSNMVLWTIRLIAGYIFDCIIFPLVIFILLLWLTRSVMRYIFQKNIQSTLRQDLRRILIRKKTQ